MWWHLLSARCLVAVVLVLSASSASADPAVAKDAGANFLVRLFTYACAPNIGQPEKVRTWASDHHLSRVTSAEALQVFVGNGPDGAAWAVPSPIGSFTLSIRGKTAACAVWARTADSGDVELLFRRLLEGIKRPGIDVSLQKEERTTSPGRAVRSLVYSVRPTPHEAGVLFTMLTAEKSGGPFQASLQVAPFLGLER